MSLSEKPARKLFLNQCAKLSEGLSSQNKYRSWILQCKTKKYPVELIWIQGNIVNVSESQNSFVINDGTEVAVIVSANKAPGYGAWITNGQYVMVIGEVVSIESNIEVRALKLTKLLDPNAESLWKLEVKDFWNFLEKS
ncbi:uncharacterized protein NPIL_572531 [Nephila pilipes]|uniref:RecQ-mediated genome instability protein 2 n=1 Tax=Nephila pilipes TaxID=299642 RepID=A0A8X6JKB3_NEPPI|nr:uncharacterized protein NPIL_572531 [Nephila pilipes]